MPNGWIILDKPLGLGSTQAVAAVKRNLREGGYGKVKVGHGGTLDPLATGILPIALGEATKLAGRMLDASKEYAFTVQFGAETDTLDLEGKVVATSDARPTLAEVEGVLPRFTGPIEQVPPAYSALMVDGLRAYDLARAGEAVELKPRAVTVYTLAPLLFRGGAGGGVSPQAPRFEDRPHPNPSPEAEGLSEITLIAHVSKGTYIRSLARDIARALGTAGHVTMLRRLRAGPFGLDQAISLDKLNDVGDPKAMQAFRFANRTMWQQRIHALQSERKRAGVASTLEEVDQPENRSWRPFQLAFVLLNLPGVTQLDHADRSESASAIADLLWFPTGGGKTEAYLGLTAYTLAMRRLQGVVGGRLGHAGVAVIMRYTLRLLTLQQFQRAAALICACEVIRRADPGTWGAEPFRIGLWVGMRTTPNTIDDAHESILRSHGAGAGRGIGSPLQLTNCPWCGSEIKSGQDVKVETYNQGRARVFTFCGDQLGRCDFSRVQSPDEGIPVLTVDEEIYRRLPALLIATVDKFAQMPWNGRTQMLFGQVDGYCPRHGFTSPCMDDATSHPARNGRSAVRRVDHGPLRPPDLIIQDELHLISGPLGSLVGLYEAAVDQLCTWTVAGKTVRPKVIASTATIRQAREQIRALFLRDVRVFPPQGLDAEDNFFSIQRAPSDKYPGRRYIGIAAFGRRLKLALIRVYVAYLAASQTLFLKYGRAVDPWMTLLGYFNSIRELGGMRRMVDDDVRSRLRDMDRRGLSRRNSPALEELTSRKNSRDIPALLDRLEVQHDPGLPPHAKRQPGQPVTPYPLDVVLATNMVSVGVDIKRLGLMVVAGQPKGTSEYIQATSRVGRNANAPGLVCTVYNWARPRDLSHYERFAHYHDTFYQHVEALSVTPFAARAIDRGLSAVLASLVRLPGATYNANGAAGQLDRVAAIVQAALAAISRRAAEVTQSSAEGQRVQQLLQRRLDLWLREAAPKPGGAKLGYQMERDGLTRALLQRAGLGDWEPFTCLGSLRDVEPSVNLLLDDRPLDDGYGQAYSPVATAAAPTGALGAGSAPQVQGGQP